MAIVFPAIYCPVQDVKVTTGVHKITDKEFVQFFVVQRNDAKEIFEKHKKWNDVIWQAGLVTKGLYGIGYCSVPTFSIGFRTGKNTVEFIEMAILMRTSMIENLFAQIGITRTMLFYFSPHVTNLGEIKNIGVDKHFLEKAIAVELDPDFYKYYLESKKSMSFEILVDTEKNPEEFRELIDTNLGKITADLKESIKEKWDGFN